MTYYYRPRQVVQIPLDKLLFFIASLYFGLTVTWIFTHQKPKQVNAATINTKSPSNEEFIANLEKLEIEQKTVTAKVAKPSPQATLVPPVVRIAPPPPPPVISAPATPTTPVERIYIPVYPQNPSFAPVKPKKITASPIKLPPPPPPSPVVTVAPSAIPVPTMQYNAGGKLVGVLESGERSSALFDVNGLTKRVAIGENINGWVLVQIQNQQVFLNRGSTTKVIDVGQSF